MACIVLQAGYIVSAAFDADLAQKAAKGWDSQSSTFRTHRSIVAVDYAAIAVNYVTKGLALASDYASYNSYEKQYWRKHESLALAGLCLGFGGGMIASFNVSKIPSIGKMLLGGLIGGITLGGFSYLMQKKIVQRKLKNLRALQEKSNLS